MKKHLTPTKIKKLGLFTSSLYHSRQHAKLSSLITMPNSKVRKIYTKIGIRYGVVYK